MAADKVSATSAHVTLTANVAYTLHLTANTKYVDVAVASNQPSQHVYFAVANTEAGLPTVTVGGDDLNIANFPQRTRVPVPRGGWIRLISDEAVVVSVERTNHNWYPDRFRAFTAPTSNPPAEVDALIVAGGGGTNSGSYSDNGGGGAGGYLNSYGTEPSGANSTSLSAISVTEGVSYTVTVGAGGAARTQGSNSVCMGRTAIGGGYQPSTGLAQSGGSGAGGSPNNSGNYNGASGTAGQGNAGGNAANDAYYTQYNIRVGAGGGGGGAGVAGSNAIAGNQGGNVGGNGGNGLASSITGSAVTRAGGGAGAATTAVSGGTHGNPGSGGGGAVDQNGTANTGGGAGGRSSNAGGSGIVIIRFEGDSPTISAGLTYTESTVGDDTVIQFTAGTGTISW